MEAERYCIDKAPNQLGDLASVTDADTYEFIVNMNGRRQAGFSINGKWNNKNVKTKLPFFCQYTLKGEDKIFSSLRMTRLRVDRVK